MMLAAHTTTGKPWPTRPPCPTPPERGRVIILTAEDGLEDTVAPRVGSCGGERDKVTVIKGTNEGSDGYRTFNLLTDIRKLEHLIEKLKDVRLVIIDPVSAYLGVGKAVDTYKDKDVRAALMPVSSLAERYNVTVIGVVHLNKGKELQAIYRVSGSMAFVAAARAVWLIGRDPQDKTIKHFVPVKCNLSVEDPGGLSFIISSNRIEFLEGESEYDADTLLAPREKRMSKQGIAQRFLMDLAEGKTEVDAREAISKAKKGGISDATLGRARIDMGIESKQVWDNKQKKRVWKLPSGK
jgi:putative DNA primase/helicase